MGAINAGTAWECRATGNVANGGGYYNLVPGTSVDYSQQDTAQLSLTDLACVAAAQGTLSHFNPGCPSENAMSSWQRSPQGTSEK